MKGTVFNIQRFSIHDGPGIRTTVFMKGCPIRCFWCQNPESQSMRPELLFDRGICTGCGACASVCPHGANRIAGASATLDRKLCNGCGACVKPCPPAARKLEGKLMTADEVMATVMKDKAIYKTSGGGITLSGGDPTMQPEFALALLRKSRGSGLNTALETCGHTSWDVLKSLLEYTDFLLFDIKTMDSQRHRTGTGHGNELILENAKKASALDLAMTVRSPMIPGFNDSKEDVEAIARFVTSELMLPAGRLSLLRYNKYAEGKYERLDRDNERPRFEPQPQEYMDELTAILHN